MGIDSEGPGRVVVEVEGDMADVGEEAIGDDVGMGVGSGAGAGAGIAGAGIAGEGIAGAGIIIFIGMLIIGVFCMPEACWAGIPGIMYCCIGSG